MYQIGVRELKNQTSEVVRRVRAGEPVALTYHGRIIAHVVPVDARPGFDRAEVEAALDDLDQLAAEIGAMELGPVDAVTLAREQRGDA